MAKTGEQLKREEDHLKLLKQKEENARKLLNLEKRKGEMRKEMQSKEMELLNQEMAFCQLKMTCLTRISMAMSEKDKYDDFRSSSLKMIRQFKKFEESFLEDANTMKPILNGKQKWNSKKPEKLNDASSALQDFLDHAQSLTVIEDKEVATDVLLKNQEVVIGNSGDLHSKLLEIITELEVGVEDGKIEDMESLKNLYIEAEVEVKQLEKLVAKFEVPPTKRLEKSVIHQMQILSSKMPQITNNAQMALEEAKEKVEDQQQKNEQKPEEKKEDLHAEIQKEEEQMNMLEDLMSTITNFSGLLEQDQSEENIQSLMSNMKEMFSELSGLLEQQDGEEDAEMQQIRYLMGAIMELTKGNN